MSEFTGFPKIPRYSRECVITEKIDGTNASVYIEGGTPVIDPKYVIWTNGIYRIAAGSRARWITPEDDNFGFAAWVRDHAAGRDGLEELGPGHHFGEWWGSGIQRGYGLSEKRFSLFNVARWLDPHTTSVKNATEEDFAPTCCHVVPVLGRGEFGAEWPVLDALLRLRSGSVAAPGFMDPEGVIIYHTAANQMFKKTLGDDDGKGETRAKKVKPHRPHENYVHVPAIMWTGGRRKSGAPYPEHAERRVPK